jgi:hypothetical protein
MIFLVKSNEEMLNSNKEMMIELNKNWNMDINLELEILLETEEESRINEDRLKKLNDIFGEIE